MRRRILLNVFVPLALVEVVFVLGPAAVFLMGRTGQPAFEFPSRGDFEILGMILLILAAFGFVPCLAHSAIMEMAYRAGAAPGTLLAAAMSTASGAAAAIASLVAANVVVHVRSHDHVLPFTLDQVARGWIPLAFIGAVIGLAAALMVRVACGGEPGLSRKDQ